MSEHRQDEYLDPSEYLNHTADDSGFNRFSQGGSYYFSKLDGDRVVFMSQGYTSEAGRDNGIESVKKNMVLEERYSANAYNDKWYISLKAGNRQEIAVSPLFATKEEALALKTGSGTYAVSSSKVSGDVLKSEEKEDDYLPTKEYEGHPVNDKVNNVAMFKHENGQYYFALYNKDGSVKLRSEGFETAKNRDQELSGVLKYHNDDSMYTTLHKGKYSMLVLKDKEGNEVGRSGLIKEVKGETPTAKVSAIPIAAAAGSSAALVGFLGSMKIGDSASTITKVDNSKTIYFRDEVYLPMSKYNANLANKSMIDGNFIQFSEDGKFFFGLLDSDGKMAIRSTGYATSADRDSAVKAASVGKYNGANYSILETRKGKYYVLLRDGAHNEIGRSVAFDSRAEAVGFVPETTVTYQTVGSSSSVAGYSGMATKATAAMVAASKSSFVAKTGGAVATAVTTTFNAAPVIAPVATKAAAAAGWGLVPWAAGLLLLPLLFLLKTPVKLVPLSPVIAKIVPPPPPVIPPPIPPPPTKVQLVGPKVGPKVSGF